MSAPASAENVVVVPASNAASLAGTLASSVPSSSPFFAPLPPVAGGNALGSLSPGLPIAADGSGLVNSAGLPKEPSQLSGMHNAAPSTIISPNAATPAAPNSSPTLSKVTAVHPPIIGNAPNGKKTYSLSYTVAPDAGPVPMDCGISILAHAKNVTVRDYLIAIVSSGVPAHCITDASRLGGTIQVFFKTPNFPLSLIANGLMFRGQRVDVLPVGISARKVTLSDVPSFAPEEVVNDVFAIFGTVQGKVHTLPASVSNVAPFNNIRSCRRMAYLSFATPADFDELPEAVDVNINGIQYSFQVNVPLHCYQCGATGHSIQTCPSTRRAKPHSNPTLSTTSSSQSKPPSAAGQKKINQSHSTTTKPTVLHQNLVRSQSLVTLSNKFDPLVSQVDPAESEDETAMEGDLPAEVSSAMEADLIANGFTLVQRRNPRKRLRPTQHMPPPRGGPKLSPSPYKYNPDSNEWADKLGSFEPDFDMTTVQDYLAKADSVSPDEKRDLVLSYAPTVDLASTLCRQIVVFSYVDPSIAAITPSAQKQAARRKYYNLSRLLMRAFPDFLPPDSDSQLSQ